MNIPDKVKIGGTIFTIRETDKPITDMDSKLFVGRAIYSECLILIYNGTIDGYVQSKQAKEATLIHEILHAIIHDRKIDLGENEEKITSALEYGLYALIKDNPDLFKEVT